MSNLLLNTPPLVILPELAVTIGLNEAIVLQQIHFWLQKSGKQRDGRVWVYNSTREWQEQFPWWSEVTLKRIMASLRRLGIVETGNYNRAKMDRTNWYTINYDSPFLTALDQVDTMHSAKLIRRLGQIDTTNTIDYTEINQILKEEKLTKEEKKRAFAVWEVHNQRRKAYKDSGKAELVDEPNIGLRVNKGWQKATSKPVVVDKD